MSAATTLVLVIGCCFALEVRAANGAPRFEPMLQPFQLAMANTTSMYPGVTGIGGVRVDIQLESYVNQYSILPGGLTCVCASNFNCDYLGNLQAKCNIGFTVFVSSADEPLKYVATQPVTLSPSGVLDLQVINADPSNPTILWSAPYSFYLNYKPTAIDIFVHHTGVIIHAADGTLQKLDGAMHMDTFSLLLKDDIPLVGTTGTSSSQKLYGSILNTQLNLTYSVRCMGKEIGPDCDLICNTSSTSADIAVCRSSRNNIFYTCHSATNGQVKDCTAYPSAGGNLLYPDGGLNPATASVVSKGFRTATIILGIACAILLILLIVVTIYSCVLVKRSMHQEAETGPGYNVRSSMRADGSANRPLLQASYTAQSPVSQDPYQRPPIVPPRSVPSLDAVPTKSSLRKPNQIPPAHLGGGSSINDTLNSSFASSVPMPPSREADV